MPTTFRPYEPEQPYLLPPDMGEWLPEDHLAYRVSDLVDAVDLKAFYVPYERDGSQDRPYDPRMMVKVILFGYATGVVSSRALARNLEEDVAFRVLGAGNFPGHQELSAFRLRHLDNLKDVFVSVARLARAVGMAGIGNLSVEGTKARANASKPKASRRGRTDGAERQLKGQIGRLMARSDKMDADDDARFGAAFRGDEVPQEMQRREDRLAAIREAKKRLEALRREAGDERGHSPN